jgi:hypothetical protein
MNRTAILVLLAFLCPGHKALPAEPAKPAELKVLERFVGAWDCEVVMRPALWTPKEVREKSVEINEMALDGWFLQGLSTTRNGTTNAILMNTYDSTEKKYRVWRFLPGGSCEELSGQWDEATSTMTITTDLGQGITQTAAFHLIGKDHREYQVTAKDSEGRVYLDVHGKVTRRKQPPSALEQTQRTAVR